eukprot:Partr_v1_DN24184_c0_g1_i3_m70949 putative Protein kinase, AMP-activated, beta
MQTAVPVEIWWHHGGKNVVVTGSFDNWKQSVRMTRQGGKTSDEFLATVSLEPHQRVSFKFVVDGVWRCSGEFPTESDQHGNVNNWLVVPEPLASSGASGALKSSSSNPTATHKKSLEKLTSHSQAPDASLRKTAL